MKKLMIMMAILAAGSGPAEAKGGGKSVAAVAARAQIAEIKRDTAIIRKAVASERKIELLELKAEAAQRALDIKVAEVRLLAQWGPGTSTILRNGSIVVLRTGDGRLVITNIP